MKHILICLFASALIFACSKEEKGGDKSKKLIPEGSRVFKVDSNSAAFIVSISGVNMGTPDGQAVAQTIEDAVSSNLVDRITDLDLFIEGGVHSCLEIQNSENREFVIASLKSVETSLDESNYSIESVAGCP